MSPQAQPESSVAPDDQLQRELQLLVQRHAEFTRRLEAVLAELQGAQPLPAASSQRNPSAPALAPDGVAKQIAGLHERLSRLETQIDTANHQIGVNTSRIHEILDSRTWRAFTGMGGVLLRLLGRR